MMNAVLVPIYAIRVLENVLDSVLLDVLVSAVIVPITALSIVILAATRSV